MRRRARARRAALPAVVAGSGPLPALVLGVVLVLVWWAVTATGTVTRIVLPPPADVVATLVELAATGDLLPAVAATFSAAGLGAVLGGAVGLPLAWVLVHGRWFAAALEPYVAASQAVPAIALAPLLVLWIGYGLPSIAVLCALLVFFPIVIATTLGLRTLDPEVVAAARVDGASGWRLLRHIEGPLALPAVLSGLRNGVTLAVTGAVVGEFVMGGEGLGLLLVAQRDRSDTAGLFATLLVLCALATAAYALVRLLERRWENS
ncbi:ABC transporter permease subunit [Auraticoccus sp. F435]|uniref:ABC transporter permease subunit n=1 Tax=Auraticoccus cholistanensis TaxID=2656650 RepID=A0A6A9UTG6_9ACTN|nr:ABC transporter permease subunit [Auraticoccus cholistanensis]